MATYSIRDLEKVSGIKAHTIRIWEQRYGIFTPKRTETNIRYYDDEDLRLILSISNLITRGFKISRIASMSPAQTHRACLEVVECADEHQEWVGSMTLAMIDMDEARFEKALSRCTLKFGLVDTMTKVIFPFFERVGILWQTGTIRPAQEHFISNLIRQKLIVAIDAQEFTHDASKQRVILFLPEHELHEIGLLFSSYLLRAVGVRVVYLGQSVPEDDLASVLDTHPSEFMFTILTMMPQRETTEEYVRRLCMLFPKARLLVAGLSMPEIQNPPPNFLRVARLTDLPDLIR